MLTNKKNVNIVEYSCLKSEQVARTSLAAELIALSNAFDIGSRIRTSLNYVFETDIPFKSFIDSINLFDGAIDINPSNEKQLLIYQYLVNPMNSEKLLMWFGIQVIRIQLMY